VLRLHFDETLGECDLSEDGGSLVEGADLETMVLISLFSDAPAREGDGVDPESPRAGWYADAFNADGDITGSRLWTLKRAKLVKTTVVRAKEYADEALAWMVSDGIAAKVENASEILTINGVRSVYLSTLVYRPNEPTPIPFGPWDAMEAA
jgi:phage gp46-like protein